MTDNQYIEEITRIARENIYKADDAGLGMYNFDLWLKKPIQGKVYPQSIILQTYPYKEKDYYGLVYLLCYYPLDKEEMNWEHEDYNFFDLTDEEKEYVFNEFKKEMEETNNKTNMDMTKLSAFVKKDITFEEKVRLIANWEDDRGSDGEYVYDLDDDDDAWSWKELYDLKTLYKCRAEGRYWMGGWQFGCNGRNTKGNCSTAWCITEEKMKNLFTDNSILGEIADRFEDWMMANEGYDVEEKAISDFSNIYGNLIDFKAYRKAQEPTKYKWVAISSDNAFDDECIGSFDSIVDCYNNMRSHALKKMEWNTEYSDVTASDVEDYIGYDVEFHKDRIIHTSYSGTYVYKIVPATTIFNSEYKKAFLGEVNSYVRSNDYYKTIRYRSTYEDIDKDIQVKGHETAYNGESEWETGISHSGGQYFVSVFFPNRVNPTHSMDIPIETISDDELLRIIRTFSVKNRRDWERRTNKIVEN